MPVFLIPWLLRLGGVLLVGLFIAGAWFKLTHWCNTACRNLEKDVAALKVEVSERDASIALTQKRATELAMLWASQVDKTDAAAHIAEASRVQEFGKLADRAKSIGAGGVSHFGGIAVGLFRDAANSAAGSSTPSAASEPAKTVAADTGSAEEYVVSLYEWIATCKARVDEWASFYKGLQDASTSIAPAP